jgi:hypothetical protein
LKNIVKGYFDTIIESVDDSPFDTFREWRQFDGPRVFEPPALSNFLTFPVNNRFEDKCRIQVLTKNFLYAL